MGFTPFFLAYETEAVLPSNLDHGAPRVKAFDHDRATKAQQDTVDLLEEAHETTVIHFARYQQIFAGTMKGRSGGGYSKSVISNSEGPNQQRKNPNSLHQGKGPIR